MKIASKTRYQEQSTLEGKLLDFKPSKKRRGKSPSGGPLVMEQRRLIGLEMEKARYAHEHSTIPETANIAGAYWQGLLRALELNDLAAEILAGRVIA